VLIETSGNPEFGRSNVENMGIAPPERRNDLRVDQQAIVELAMIRPELELET
jgi:hypothetical protein